MEAEVVKESQPLELIPTFVCRGSLRSLTTEYSPLMAPKEAEGEETRPLVVLGSAPHFPV